MTTRHGITNDPHMAISDPPPNETRAPMPDWSVTRLEDDALAYYLDWRADALTAAEAYWDWCQATESEHSVRFSAYTAALDQEEAAALDYARAITQLEQATTTRITQSTR
jgi:hypothetical protein